MQDKILEVCVDSIESAIAAKNGGADRLELCSNLIIGGTTPSESLFREIRRRCDIKIHVLIRPRFGDFCYTDGEFSVMRDEVRRYRELGADGVVIGALRPDGTIDIDRLNILMEEAKGLSVTLHRAFDVCRDPFETLEQAISLGFATILTSGQKNSCIEGIALLKQLKEQANGRVHLMAGAGISAEFIPEIYKETGITHFHMSGKTVLDSPMIYRKEGISMGLPGFSEFQIYRTKESFVREARETLDNLEKGDE